MLQAANKEKNMSNKLTLKISEETKMYEQIQELQKNGDQNYKIISSMMLKTNFLKMEKIPDEK